MRNPAFSLLLPLLLSLSAPPARAIGAGSLAEFALQKVLADAEEVFGSSSSSTAGTSRSRNANWMARVPDATPLSHLSIPGLHDAATWNYSQETQDRLLPASRCGGSDSDNNETTFVAPARVYRCQRRSVADALDAGVRFFDLRFAADPAPGAPSPPGLTFWHGAALLASGASGGVEGALLAFYAWLDAHPSEALLLSFQYEGGSGDHTGSGEAVQQRLLDALASGAAARYVDQGRWGGVRTLGEVRGKAVLFRRFDLDALGAGAEDRLPGLHLSPARWPDNSPSFELVYDDDDDDDGAGGGATLYGEDMYEPSERTAAEDIAAKFGAVARHLEKAAAASGGAADAMFITFASGEHVAAVPPVFPETMALGTDGAGGEGVNHRLAALLRQGEGKRGGRRLGIVVLDFWDEPEGLVDLIIGS